jgi:hypothetical protein
VHDDRSASEYLAECVAVLERRSRRDPLPHRGRGDPRDRTRDQDYESELDQIGADRASIHFRNLILSSHWAIDGFGVMRGAELTKTERIAPYAGSDRVMRAELGLRGRLQHLPRVLFQSRDFAGRSIRSPEIRERGAWFDPKLTGRIIFPHWRHFLEYNRAILRTPLSLEERKACWSALVRFAADNRRRDDLQFALSKLTSGMVAGAGAAPPSARAAVVLARRFRSGPFW